MILLRILIKNRRQFSENVLTVNENKPSIINNQR